MKGYDKRGYCEVTTITHKELINRMVVAIRYLVTKELGKYQTVRNVITIYCNRVYVVICNELLT